MLHPRVKEFIAGLGEAELRQYVVDGTTQYEAEAVEYARAEAQKRGLIGAVAAVGNEGMRPLSIAVDMEKALYEFRGITQKEFVARLQGAVDPVLKPHGLSAKWDLAARDHSEYQVRIHRVERESLGFGGVLRLDIDVVVLCAEGRRLVLQLSKSAEENDGVAQISEWINEFGQSFARKLVESRVFGKQDLQAVVETGEATTAPRPDQSTASALVQADARLLRSLCESQVKKRLPFDAIAQRLKDNGVREGDAQQMINSVVGDLRNTAAIIALTGVLLIVAGTAIFIWLATRKTEVVFLWYGPPIGGLFLGMQGAFRLWKLRHYHKAAKPGSPH